MLAPRGTNLLTVGLGGRGSEEAPTYTRYVDRKKDFSPYRPAVGRLDRPGDSFRPTGPPTWAEGVPFVTGPQGTETSAPTGHRSSTCSGTGFAPSVAADHRPSSVLTFLGSCFPEGLPEGLGGRPGNGVLPPREDRSTDRGIADSSRRKTPLGLPCEGERRKGPCGSQPPEAGSLPHRERQRGSCLQGETEEVLRGDEGVAVAMGPSMHGDSGLVPSSSVPAFLKDWGPAGERRSPPPRESVNRWGNRRLLAPEDPSCSPLGRGETHGPVGFATSGNRVSPSQGAVRPISGTKFSPSQGETERVLLAGGRRSSSGERPRGSCDATRGSVKGSRVATGSSMYGDSGLAPLMPRSAPFDAPVPLDAPVPPVISKKLRQQEAAPARSRAPRVRAISPIRSGR